MSPSDDYSEAVRFSEEDAEAVGPAEEYGAAVMQSKDCAEKDAAAMGPAVSIITPVYNSMPYFRDYLASVADQTWRPLELILVDDGSDDGSFEYAADSVRALRARGIAVRLMRQDHSGQAAAVNAGLKEVTGDLFTWCDADDVLLPRSVEKKAEFLLRNPSYGMVRSDGLVINGDTGEVLAHSASDRDRGEEFIFEGLLRQRTYCYAGCYMLRTELLRECYPDMQIPLSAEGQNLQLLLPPASRSACGFVPDVLHRYYRRSSGHSSQKKSFTQAAARIGAFAELEREILRYCDVDREYYLGVIEEVRAANMLMLQKNAAARIREKRSV